MFDFENWGSWGIGDFYKGNDIELKKALERDEPFDTGWHGFKKELQSMRIFRGEENITVEVSEYTDEALEQTELFCDFLTDEECEKLTDELLEEIRECLLMGDFVEETQEKDTLPKTASFEEVIKKAEELAEQCSQTLKDSFRECIEVTLFLMYKDSPDQKQIIEDRLKENGFDISDSE